MYMLYTKQPPKTHPSEVTMTILSQSSVLLGPLGPVIHGFYFGVYHLPKHHSKPNVLPHDIATTNNSTPTPPPLGLHPLFIHRKI